MLTHNSRQFFFNNHSKVFSIDISEMTDGGTKPFTERIYSDSCDQGFIMVSAKTGNESFWFLKETVYMENDDNEVSFWLFSPTTETTRNFPELSGYVVTVFND